MGASVVAGVDASPVFDFAEHILDAVTLAIECAVIVKRRPKGTPDRRLKGTPWRKV